MKVLSGVEIAKEMKARQAQKAAELHKRGVVPKLAIVQAKDDPVINTYVRLKKQYGGDIGVEVDIHFIPQAEIPYLLKRLNADPNVHGIIVQLPLEKPAQTDEILNQVSAAKDVDGLGRQAEFEPATPKAILRLLAGNDISLAGKKVLIIGRGKLVGEPLAKILDESSIDVEAVDREVANLKDLTLAADVIITATGSPSIIFPDMLKSDAVVVDAGVASEAGKTVGDVAEAVYQRDDVAVTPSKGGVGPLTVCALFENVLAAAEKAAENSGRPRS